MKKLVVASAALVLSAGTALAGTMIILEPDPEVYVAPAPTYNWTGAYAGLSVGAMAAQHRWSFPTALDSRFDPDPSGLTGGVFIGYNWHTNRNLVIGVEADVHTSSATGTDDYRDVDGNILGAPGSVVGHSRIRTTAAARIRAGVAMDRSLLYVAGGVASANYTLSWDNMGVEQDSWNGRRNGWTVGAGVEYAMNSNLRLRGELRYADFGTVDYDATAFTLPSRSHLTTTEVRLGVAFNF